MQLQAHYNKTRLKTRLKNCPKNHPKNRQVMRLYVPIVLVYLASISDARSIGLASHKNGLYRRDDANTTTSTGLSNKVKNDYEATAKKAAGAKAYLYSSDNNIWFVSAVESCEPELGPEEPLAPAFICPKEESGPCTHSFKVIDSQSFTNEIGVFASFTVEAGADVGVASFKVSATVGASASHSETYSTGKEVLYEYHPKPGTSCTVTRVSYRLRCKGSIWQVGYNPNKDPCSQFTIDFKDVTKWFRHPQLPGEFQYIDKSVSDKKLLSIFSKTKYRPTSCDQVDGVKPRDLKLLQETSMTSAVRTKSGQFLDAISCIYPPGTA
ncbi:hypothetical protein EDD11_005166 [Mortierella claussenii]|nr:hypothetical protein EDD11_005166 [Mortierella claussenii]